MKRNRRLSMESLEQRIALSGVGLNDPQPTVQWESVIVALNDNIRDPGAVARGVINAHGGQLGHIYERAVKGFSAQLPDAALQALLHNPQVKRIEPDLTMQAFAPQVTPNGVDRIEADLKLSGSPVTVDVGVAVIDTGIDRDHPDLNVAGGTHFYTVTTGRKRGSFQDDNYEDDNGHGSHVAGIVGAKDNDEGVVGVAPGVRLYAVKVLNANGSGYLSDIIAGIDWVTAHADTIDVVNMSLGGQGVSATYRTAIQNSVGAGIVYVVAAGNDWGDILGDDLTFGTSDDRIPAAYPEVATISAFADTNGTWGGGGGFTSYGGYADDTFADFSNFSNSDNANVSWYDTNNPLRSDGERLTSPGKGIDLTMPGVDIYSTYKNGGYATMSGTSMAAPHAAGLAALYIAAHGRAGNAAEVYDIRQALIDGGKPWRSEYGLQFPDTGGNPDSPDKHEENLGWAAPSSNNTAPVAVDDSGSTNEDTAITINVLSNDSDPDGDSLSVTSVSAPGNGTAAINEDNTVTYTPGVGFTGADSFDYTISDGNGGTATATVSITVSAANANALYVYDIRFESKRGNKDWRAVFEIRSDSNADGQGTSADAVAAGVTITVEFAGQTYTGTTDSDGVFRTNWITNLGSGDHYAEVVDLVLAYYVWDPLSLDLENDSDGDGLPDDVLSR